MTQRTGVFATVICLAIMPCATAQTREENMRRCTDGSPDAKIAGCTALIESGQLTTSTFDLALAFAMRGGAYHAKGDHDRAIQDYDQVIHLVPTMGAGFNSRGSAYSSKGDYDRAIQDYDQAIRLNSTEAIFFSARGDAYSAKGQYDRAIQDYDVAIKLNPNEALAFYGRGMAKQKKGDAAGRDADIAAARRLRPDLFEQMPNVGLTAEAQQALAAGYWDEVYRNTTLSDAQKRSLVEKGLEAVDSALRMKPDYVEALVYKGLLLRMQASMESDPARQRSLLAEAVALQEKAAVAKQAQTPR